MNRIHPSYLIFVCVCVTHTCTCKSKYDGMTQHTQVVGTMTHIIALFERIPVVPLPVCPWILKRAKSRHVWCALGTIKSNHETLAKEYLVQQSREWDKWHCVMWFTARKVILILSLRRMRSVLAGWAHVSVNFGMVGGKYVRHSYMRPHTIT